MRRQRRPWLDDLHNHDHRYFGFDAALDDRAADREVTARRGGRLPRGDRVPRSISEYAECCELHQAGKKKDNDENQENRSNPAPYSICRLLVIAYIAGSGL